MTQPSEAHGPPPILTPPEVAASTPEAVQARAAVEDLAEAPAAEKKAIAVDQKLLMTEVQLLLAEKRTSFALMRTGVTIALVPLSIWSVLIATSRLWNVWEVLWVVIPLAVILGALLLLGGYLIAHAMHHLAHIDRVLSGLCAKDTLLEDLLIKHGRAHRVVKPWTWRDPSRRKGRGSSGSG